MPSARAAVPLPGPLSAPAAPGLPTTGWSLHRYLRTMVLAVLLPLLTLAGVLIWYDMTRQYDLHRRGMLDTVQALSLAVDREWATVQAVLGTLGTSPLLDAEDFRTFYDLCVRAAARYPDARIVLFAPSGQQLLNTLRPFGADLPNPFTESATQSPARVGELPVASPETVRRAFQTGEPVYSDLFVALVSQRPTVSLDMPVRREGHVVYVLTMAMFPEVFTRLLQERGRSADAISTIVDRRGMIIARSWEPEQTVGRFASSELRAALDTSATGWGYGRTVEQSPVYRVWTLSPVTGWTTVISVPEASITSPIRRSLVFWGGSGVLALGLGLGLALFVARQITTPLAALTRSADLVQRGQSFAMPRVAIQEIQTLYAALAVTVDALHQQATEREHRRVAEAEAAERQRAAEVLAEANAALRQAEAAERAQREQWQTTLASIGDAVIVTDPAGHVRFLNAVAHTLTGWAPEEATGQPLPQIFRIVNEQTRQPVENPAMRVIREGVIVGLANHTVLIAKDGRETPIDDSGAPIRDAQGQIGGAVLVFRDITVRKQAEAAQRCLAEVSTLLAAAGDLSTQLERLARLLVPTLADWCSLDLLQDDGQIHRLAVVHADPAKAALAEQLRQQYPILAAEAPHTLSRVLRTGQPWFDPAVSAARLLAEARDTAHRELEQALGFTAEMVVPLLARGRVLGTITCVLGEGTRRYSAADLALAEELARRAAVAIDNARLYQEAQAARATLQQANADLERRVEERTAALYHAMAERQRLEREAQRAEHFALLGRLAAGVSHEIRNPLGAISLHVEVLEEELRTPSPDSASTVAESLAEITTQLARLGDLVEDYLALVRVGNIQQEVQDLGAAIQAWGTEFQTEAVPRGVTLRLEGVASLGPVAFHASTLRRALLNLVQNAAEAMPQGGTVTLAGQATATQVQLAVRDTGGGIPAARLGQIFEPLYTTKPGGTGLGLYIVQEIVAAHGGQVTVQSAEGHGTTFTITLPRAASAATVPRADEAPLST